MERTTFEQLVQQWAPRATALARAIAGDSEAEDVAQEAFIRAWRSIHTLADPAKFDAWLMTIVRNLARNRLRDLAFKRRVPPPPSSSPSPDLDHVRAAVDALPEEQREVVRLRFEVEMSYAEIASALGIEEALVKSRLHEAKVSLAARIKLGGE